MGFLQNTFLFAAAAVAIPLIVHLLSRQQVRRLELGTMRFLDDVIQDGYRRRQFRRWFLLAVRCLSMLLLAFLFARPFLVEQLAQRNGERSRIILIDRSGSMGVKGNDGRLVDDAISVATQAAADAGKGTSIDYVWFDRHVQPLPAEETVPAAPRTVVGETDYAAALRWVKTTVAQRPEQRIDVVVVTDLQQNGINRREVTAELNFPADVPVQVIDVGREAVNNLAVTQLAAASDRILPGQTVQLDATLFNFGSLPFEEVTTRAVAYNGERTVRIRRTINIAAGEAQDLKYEIPGLEAGIWQITLSVDAADDLISDNQRFTAVEVAAPAAVAVLGDVETQEGLPSGAYYVAAALTQDGAEPGSANEDSEGKQSRGRLARFAPQAVSLTDGVLPPLDVSTFPLVVLTDAADADAQLLAGLRNYVEAGGRLLVFAGDVSDSLKQQWQKSGLAPGMLEKTLRSGAMPFRITSVNSGADMMQPFLDPQQADLSRLSFGQILPVQVEDSSSLQVLAEFNEGYPAMTRHALGDGSVAWFLSTAGSNWSPWTASPLYLPVVQQMAADLLALTGEGRIRHRSVGDDSHRALMTSMEVGQWTPVKTSSAQDAERLAVYESEGFETSGDVLYVVNSDAQESDPARMSVSDFAKHFEVTLAGETPDRETVIQSVQDRHEIWPWLAAILFVLLFFEFCLANRTTA